MKLLTIGGNIVFSRIGLVIAGSVIIATCVATQAVGGKPVLASRATANTVLTIAWDNEPDSLNPALTGYLPVLQVDRNVFDTLTWEKSDGTITPDLATGWRISNGGRTYTFTLRHGVKFTDGTPFNAAAVVANLNYINDPKTHSISAIGALGPYKSSHAVSKYQVVVNFKSPYGPCLARYGEPLIGMQSPAATKQYPTHPTMLPIGTGPFKFANFTPNASFELLRNPDYNWAPPELGHNGPASIGKIVYDIVPTGQARVNQLQTGEAQLVNNTPALYYRAFKNNPAYREITQTVSGVPVSAVINNSKWPTNTLAVRKALIYSINRVGVIKLADSGQYSVASGPVQIGTIGYDPHLVGKYQYSPAKAAQVLTAAGWKKVGGIWTKGGRKLTIEISTNPNLDFSALAQAIQGYLQKAGMIAPIKLLATPAWVGSMLAGKENLSPAFFYTDVDADVLRLMFTNGQYFDWWKYNNPTVSQLLQKGSEEVNSSRRIQTYWKAQEIIMNGVGTIPIHVNADLLTMSARLMGVGLYPGGDQVFYTASLR